MPRQKLHRYERINNDPRVVQWLQNQHVLFPDRQNIVLELACGRWEYCIGLAPHFPDHLFVWIDSKWDRIGVWLDRTHQLWLQNVRFVCGIIHHLDRWFAPHSVEEIRIIHPDPRPRDRDVKRRLTNPRFLDMYKNILKPWGNIRLKTDDHALFDYSVEQFAWGWRIMQDSTNDLHASPLLADHFGITTHYEKLWLAEWRSICYAKRKLPNKI
jgi:tRNA (guanine-N7-)-methyltransferase